MCSKLTTTFVPFSVLSLICPRTIKVASTSRLSFALFTWQKIPGSPRLHNFNAPWQPGNKARTPVQFQCSGMSSTTCTESENSLLWRKETWVYTHISCAQYQHYKTTVHTRTSPVLNTSTTVNTPSETTCVWINLAMAKRGQLKLNYTYTCMYMKHSSIKGFNMHNNILSIRYYLWTVTTQIRKL